MAKNFPKQKLFLIKNPFQRYGKSPSHEELKATGGTCPICHDSLSEPTKLHCKHIFCEECVSTWFDREKTCPMCRAQVCKYFCIIIQLCI